MITPFRRASLIGGVPVTDTEIVAMILSHEGGVYTNHPADRGGPTKWGITIPVLTAYRGRPCTAADIMALSREEAAAIYTQNYVQPFARLGPTILRANVIDMSVNAGIVRGVKLLQQTIGAKVDGGFGGETVRLALSREWNPIFVGVRLAFYERIIENNPSQIVFRNGWRSRGLSFYGAQPRLRMMISDQPAYGHTGKAYLDAAA